MVSMKSLSLLGPRQYNTDLTRGTLTRGSPSLPPADDQQQDKKAQAHPLFLPEILTLIFRCIRGSDECLEDDVQHARDRIIGRQTLVSLAITCRFFHNPALDILWEKLDSLDPLFMLLPKRVWDGKHHFLTSIKKKDWTTFGKYASRVKVLARPYSRLSARSQYNAIMALVKCREANSSPLLPNLTELVWEDLGLYNVTRLVPSSLRHLIGERVTSITLNIYDSSLISVLSELWLACPNVTSFTVRVPPPSFPHVIAVVRQWTKLRSFRSLALPQGMMDELLTSVGLECLSIELGNPGDPTFSGILPGTLRAFSLYEGNAECHAQYLGNVYGSPQELTLRVCVDGSSIEGVAKLLHLLPERFDHAALHEFSSELTSSYEPGLRTFQLDSRFLRPLFAFRNLRTVDLETYGIGGLDDAALDAIARAWPALENFALGTGSTSLTRPQTTMNALVALLRHCPSLTRLHLPFDATVVVQAVEIPDGVVNVRITSMKVGYSPIQDADAIAAYLARLMPQLRSIASSRHPAGYHGEWLTVQKLLTH
ncbi:hypothetical protein ID866_9540 [Astraeus odoratus]|nr:hypothetical protein ID866_9540 [Astraeus odoratus]